MPVSVEQKLGQAQIGLPEYLVKKVEMAKPRIPVEAPLRRQIPDTPNPLTTPLPTTVPITEPGKPIEPRVPVPAGR